MVSWQAVEGAEPEFARRVRGVFEAHIHKTMATLRRDGAPRISGTEADFDDGEIWLGGGSRSRKVQDLRRDGRMALHGAPLDVKMVEGDAKVSGVAVEVFDEARLAPLPAGAALFRIDIREVVLTRVEDGKTLVVELWTPEGGLREFRPD
jgi:hypothetical protein